MEDVDLEYVNDRVKLIELLVGADERRVREGVDAESESSGSESGESLTSPAMVVESGFRQG